MAAKKVVARHVSWVCSNCGVEGSTHIQTTESAERHADDNGHTVVASGMIMYIVMPGTIATDDPFDSKNVR